MEYQDAMGFLQGLTDYSQIPFIDHEKGNFELQRLVTLLDLLGNPHRKLKIVHIAGTKGKGSTAVMIESVLQAAGYKTGLFTSPYLFDFREQIQINREPISQTELARYVEVIKPLLAEVEGITTFEAITAICLTYFSDQKVDVAILEAGLGGRTDATNVVEPLLSVITSISYDHMNLLGNTIEEIAAEKAGIIKPGIPVVIGKQDFFEAQETLEKAAQSVQSEVIDTENKIILRDIHQTLHGQTFSVEFIKGTEDWNGEYFIPLVGRHQLDNVTTALSVLRKLADSGYSIDKNSVQKGLAAVHWPCRFEVVCHNPLIILDGAHNVNSAEKLAQNISELLPDKKITLVFGASVDKDIEGMLNVLLPKVGQVIFTKSPHQRAVEPAMLVKLVKITTTQCRSEEKITDALNFAVSRADDKTAILVTGSLFIAAAARIILNQHGT